MAVTPFGLILLLVSLSATQVTSQEVTPQVSSTSLVLTWEKEDQWEGVDGFQVNIKMNGLDFCDATVMCVHSNTCTFGTKYQCRKFSPCADVMISVRGGNYTATDVKVVTAPEPVTNIAFKSSGKTQTITWTNPTSTCFEDTTASVFYGGYHNHTKILGHDEVSLTVPSNLSGTGSVKLRTRGGSGESDAESVSLEHLLKNDIITITGCPAQGCTDVVVQWDYNPAVNPKVTHFYVTMGENITLTTDITTRNVTFTELELNTKYDTCVYARDEENHTLASSCKECGTYPEVVSNLRINNRTDTTTEIEWDPPLCPTGDEFEYNVSCSRLLTKRRDVTTDSKYMWSELKSAVRYNLCVKVAHHNNHTAEPTCIVVLTLPAAPESLLVRVYLETSLFITWPAEIFTPNLKYRVSWGDDLENTDYTEYKSYTIDGYNTTVGPDLICVVVEDKRFGGGNSTRICIESPFPNFTPDKPDHTNVIVGVCVSAGLAVLLSVVLVVLANKETTNKRVS